MTLYTLKSSQLSESIDGMEKFQAETIALSPEEKRDNSVEIESKIVEELIKRHEDWIKRH